MSRDKIILSDIVSLTDEEELQDLINLLSLKGIISEEKILAIWKSLKKMQEELALPSLHPIKQHYYF